MPRASSSAVTWWASRSPSWRRPGRCSRSTAAHTRASGRTAAPPDRASSTASATTGSLVLVPAGAGPGQPQHGHQEFLPLPGVPGGRRQGVQLGQRRGGHLVGGVGVAELFQAADQPDLHAGQPAAVGQVTADVMGGLAGHHPVHQPGTRIGGQPGRLAQHHRGHLLPVSHRQRGHQPGHPRIRRPGQPHQRPGPHHPRIILLPVGAQHLQRLAGLAVVQRAARPRQHHRLRRRPRPLQHRVGHRIHDADRLRRLGARAQLGQPPRARDREDLRERRRPPRDPLDTRRGQARQQLRGQLCPGRVLHRRVSLGAVHPPGQVIPRIPGQHAGQVTVRRGRGHHQHLPIPAARQPADQRQRQVHIQAIGVIDDHHHRDLHRHPRQGPRRPGHPAGLPGRAVIPRIPRRRHRQRRHQQRRRRHRAPTTSSPPSPSPSCTRPAAVSRPSNRTTRGWPGRPRPAPPAAPRLHRPPRRQSPRRSAPPA